MVAEAGFDGLALDLGAFDEATAHTVRPQMQANGLTPLIVAFPKTIESLEDTLHMAVDFGAPFVDVIGQVMPIALDDMVPVIEKWIAMADRIGMPVQFETHRNCITNDLYTTLQLLDRIPQMRMCADLSHYVVDREFWFPLSDHDLGLMDRILKRSDSFQGRVASRQQIQLQLDFPQNQKWGRVVQRLVARGSNRLACTQCVGRLHICLRIGPTGICHDRPGWARDVEPLGRGANHHALGAPDVGRSGWRRLTSQCVAG